MSRRSVLRSASLQVAAAVLLLVALGGCVLIPRTQAAGCGTESVPRGASAAARAYIEAVNEASPGWAAVSDAIRQQNFRVYPTDLSAQLAVDEKFLEAVKAIEFPKTAKADAARFEDALGAYVDFVRTSSEQPGYLSAHTDLDHQLNADRASASAALRTSLHLPQNSCVRNRP